MEREKRGEMMEEITHSDGDCEIVLAMTFSGGLGLMCKTHPLKRRIFNTPTMQDRCITAVKRERARIAKQLGMGVWE